MRGHAARVTNMVGPIYRSARTDGVSNNEKHSQFDKVM